MKDFYIKIVNLFDWFTNTEEENISWLCCKITLLKMYFWNKIVLWFIWVTENETDISFHLEA